MTASFLAAVRRVAVGMTSLLVLVAAVAVLLLSRPTAVGGSVAPNPSTGPSATPVPDNDERGLPADVQAALAKLPAGTVIVDCSPGTRRLPEGVVPNKIAGWLNLHPGWAQLPHGYCADNLQATPIPLRDDSVDP